MNLTRLFVMREGIASIAMEHPTGHDCDICKAAHGDHGAFLRVAFGVDEALGETE